MTACWKCAALLEPEDRFCDSCGANQADAPTVPEAPVTAAEPTVREAPAPAAEPAMREVAASTSAPSQARSGPDAPPAVVEPTPVPTAVTMVEPAPEPAPVADPGPLLIDPVDPIGPPAPSSVQDAVEARRLLWAEIDGAHALLETIETTARPAVGTVAGTVEQHPRLTSGGDLVAELRSIEVEIRNEVQAVGERESKITAQQAEIARLNRNRIIMIGVAIAGVLLVIVLIAAAL